MNYRKYFILKILVLSSVFCFAQEQILYKQIDTTNLYMELHHPEKMDAKKKYPVMVFFFGGGWNGGDIKQFEPHAKYFSKRGAICCLVDYRVKKRQGTTPFESLKDAKSAIRYLRKHAEELSIDTSKVIAAGGSAGGHLAAATGIIEHYNEDRDDLSVSCKPNAMVLFNPVIDNGPGGYGYERIGQAYKDFSPLHNIKKGTPPTILFLGDRDKLIPVETVEYYKTVMDKVGSRCELTIFKRQGHGFFNKAKCLKCYKETIELTDTFLVSLGFLNKAPLIKIE